MMLHSIRESEKRHNDCPNSRTCHLQAQNPKTRPKSSSSLFVFEVEPNSYESRETRARETHEC